MTGYYESPHNKGFELCQSYKDITYGDFSKIQYLSGLLCLLLVARGVLDNLNLWNYDLSIPASVELHSPSFGQFTSRSCDLHWAIVGLDQGVHVAISPFR